MLNGISPLLPFRHVIIASSANLEELVWGGGRLQCPFIGTLLSLIDPSESKDMIGSKGNFSSFLQSRAFTGHSEPY